MLLKRQQVVPICIKSPVEGGKTGGGEQQERGSCFPAISIANLTNKHRKKSKQIKKKKEKENLANSLERKDVEPPAIRQQCEVDSPATKSHN